MAKRKLNIPALTGAIFCSAVIICAIFAPWLAPYDPDAQDLKGQLQGPSLRHPLGQDELGRDVISRIIWGSRASMLVGICVVSVSLLIGALLGGLAGYAGGIVDNLIMRIVDVLLAFPGILLAIAVAGILGPSLFNVIFALCLMGWVGFARLVRAQVLSVREREFVLAARSIGASPTRIIIRHVMPEVTAPVVVQATFAIAGTIIAESSLSFLGLGPQDIPTWGSMLNRGVDYLLFAPHLATFPGLLVMITVLGFNFLGDALRDAMDVRR